MVESYKSGRDQRPQRDETSGIPAQQRELREQGRRTMERLLDAGLRVFGERGYHAARVDDIVRAARTSHGTFYLYFANKEDLLRALAVECARDLTEMAGSIGTIGPDAEGRARLREFLERFLGVYRTYGPVIRAWMEDQVGDREVDRLGQRMREGGVEVAANERAAVGALMAMLERFSYGIASGRIVDDDETVLDTLTTIVHRGFFGAGR